MIAKENRLKKRKEIEEVKRKGKLFQSENFGVSVINRNNDNPTRFAFVIYSKISGLAVNRNRIRRACAETIRRNLKIIPRGYDFVFLAKKSLANKMVDEIIKETETFLLKGDFKS